jgi:hypothetical protein
MHTRTILVTHCIDPTCQRTGAHHIITFNNPHTGKEEIIAFYSCEHQLAKGAWPATAYLTALQRTEEGKQRIEIAQELNERYNLNITETITPTGPRGNLSIHLWRLTRIPYSTMTLDNMTDEELATICSKLYTINRQRIKQALRDKETGRKQAETELSEEFKKFSTTTTKEPTS